MRAAVRRKNEFDPVLERGARYDTTRLPVDEVNKEWWLNALSGRKAHLRSGEFLKRYDVISKLVTPYGM